MEKVAVHKNKQQIKADKAFEVMCKSFIKRFNKVLNSCKYNRRIHVFKNEVRKSNIFTQLSFENNLKYLTNRMNDKFGPFGYSLTLSYHSNRYDFDGIPCVAVEFSEKRKSA